MADYDVVIVGAGIAGMQAARSCPGLRVLLLEHGPSASRMALGGIAAPADLSDVEQHIEDTILTGEGLCDEVVVDRVVRLGLKALSKLNALGFEFDRRMNHEGGHRLARVRRKGGDQTGRHLTDFVRSKLPDSVVVRRAELCGLLVDEWGGRVGGVVVDASPGQEIVRCKHVVLATGGIGARFDATSNPASAMGRGLELAARCGAKLRDLEFVQFHPTALDVAAGTRPVISEALRGAGGILRDRAGKPIMEWHPQKDLAPRDVVARCVEDAALSGGCFVDLSAVKGLEGNFPSAYATLYRAGIDPSSVPVRPAVHYHMGGVLVDHQGATSLPGLWACGEVTSTGLHGANRLASNSLLEALVCGEAVGEALLGRIEASKRCEQIIWTGAPAPARVLSRAMGLSRTSSVLEETLESAFLKDDLLARLLIESALAREESRGGHYREDFNGVWGVERHTEIGWKGPGEHIITHPKVRSRLHQPRFQTA